MELKEDGRGHRVRRQQRAVGPMTWRAWNLLHRTGIGLGSGGDEKTRWKERWGREWETFENSAGMFPGPPRNPKATGKKGIDATRVGPRCPKMGRVPGTPALAKKRFNRREGVGPRSTRVGETEGISEMQTPKVAPPEG